MKVVELTVYVSCKEGDEELDSAIASLIRHIDNANAVHIATFVHGSESLTVEDIEVIGEVKNETT